MMNEFSSLGRQVKIPQQEVPLCYEKHVRGKESTEMPAIFTQSIHIHYDDKGSFPGKITIDEGSR
jgi:hypothetical protein